MLSVNCERVLYMTRRMLRVTCNLQPATDFVCHPPLQCKFSYSTVLTRHNNGVWNNKTWYSTQTLYQKQVKCWLRPQLH